MNHATGPEMKTDLLDQQISPLNSLRSQLLKFSALDF
jgi:hypothetical protein